LLPTGGFFVRDVPTLALHGINGDSARNYHLIDEESADHRWGIHPKNVYSAGNYKLRGEKSFGGIASSETTNPPEEEDSAGNCQLIFADSDR
jgi:hypothetical protein